jgi:hypothetical protein
MCAAAGPGVAGAGGQWLSNCKWRYFFTLREQVEQAGHAMARSEGSTLADVGAAPSGKRPRF